VLAEEPSLHFAILTIQISGWDRYARQTRSATESNIEKDASHASAVASG
jgi:ABC-type dipeptide/oligopeptide/nickel transport system permease subunit